MLAAGDQLLNWCPQGLHRLVHTGRPRARMYTRALVYTTSARDCRPQAIPWHAALRCVFFARARGGGQLGHVSAAPAQLSKPKWPVTAVQFCVACGATRPGTCCAAGGRSSGPHLQPAATGHAQPCGLREDSVKVTSLASAQQAPAAVGLYFAPPAPSALVSHEESCKPRALNVLQAEHKAFIISM